MEPPVKQLVESFDEIGYSLNADIEWLSTALPRIDNFFIFIQKHSMAARDLLKHYGKDWSGVEIVLKKKEYVERLTMVPLSAFIFSLSAVEYGLKLIINASKRGPLVEWVSRKRAQFKKRNRKFRLYLSRIMKKSLENNLLTQDQYNSSMDIIWLRNAIMHNNAIVDEDSTFKIGKITITAKSGEMVSHPLENRPKIIRTLVSLTRSWVESYLKSRTI